MSKKQASVVYGVPRTTKIFRLSEKFVKINHGPSPILTSEEELTLCRWLDVSAKKGFPRRKDDIAASVKEFLDIAPRKNPFKNNTPGDGWFKAFFRRHPQLCFRTSEAVTAASSARKWLLDPKGAPAADRPLVMRQNRESAHTPQDKEARNQLPARDRHLSERPGEPGERRPNASSAVSESDIRKWFNSIADYLIQEGYMNILQDLFNGDECNFQLCPKGQRVVALKGTRNVYEIDVGQAKSTLTVMFTFSATGEVTAPMIIYPNKRRTLEISKSLPADWGYGISDNGWMKAEVFYEYISQVLYPYLKKHNTKFPIILFVDGHSTHMTYNVSILCSQLEIILIALYPNATRLLQPADVVAFKPLKNGWKKGVNEWRRSNLTKEKFAPILKLAIDNHLNRDILKNGFRACGLFPWNPDSLDYSKCPGKSTQLLRTTNIQPTVKMNYETFKGIVGKELLSNFETFSEMQENESFNKLYDMWKFFHNNNDVPDINTPKDSTGTTNLINSDGEGNQIPTDQSANSELFDIANIEIVYEDSPLINNNGTDPSDCGVKINLKKDVRSTSAIDNISEPVADDLLMSSASDRKEQ
ncbi:hypothetical protein MML48_2g00008229 [Holotrichia oblita]|uniref:Uncharacterized protein n=1 Tax=Holotrichia oblita TaxID=644536 RepID=A0ACB9TIS3_HOLOL|nr:hypothetical protein MML48_2g00008229 [Holotrichia oblita]